MTTRIRTGLAALMLVAFSGIATAQEPYPPSSTDTTAGTPATTDESRMEATSDEARTDGTLPATASPLPLMTVIALASIATGVTLSRRSNA